MYVVIESYRVREIPDYFFGPFESIEDAQAFVKWLESFEKLFDDETHTIRALISESAVRGK